MFKSIGSLPGISCFGLSCGLLFLAPAMAFNNLGTEIAYPSQMPATTPESPSRLQAQLEAILRFAKDKSSNELDDLVNGLQIPESANWFATTFGEELGSSLAATYKSSWKDYQHAVAQMFRESPSGKRFHVFVKEYSPSTPVPSDSFMQAILQNSKIPLKLYTAGVGKDHPIGTLPGIYIYSQGSFRVVSWRTFYGLPNVKPARIRVGTSVAMSQLIRQVNSVLSPEARQKHIQGTVLLHIVIDRDGSVVLVDPVSGPPELIQESVDAVRQWLFKPTLLNGDPVEVDTTVTIVFSNAGLASRQLARKNQNSVVTETRKPYSNSNLESFTSNSKVELNLIGS
jgi:TonB family protein